MLVSYGTDFHPGYVYGLFAGYTLAQSKRLNKIEEQKSDDDVKDKGRAVLLSVLCVLGVGLLAWAAWEPVKEAADGKDVGFACLL